MNASPEEDSVLSILKRIEREAVANFGMYRLIDADLMRAMRSITQIRDLAREAIAQIEAMSTLDGQRSYALGIEEKRKELEQRSADPGLWPGDPPQSDSDFTGDTCTTAD